MGFPLRTNSGSTQNLWGMRDYGFRGLWDKRASTVFRTLRPASGRFTSKVLLFAYHLRPINPYTHVCCLFISCVKFYSIEILLNVVDHQPIITSRESGPAPRAGPRT